jgi:hypothetical protein
MGRATALRNKLNAAQNKYGPMSRTSYKRVVTFTGGDPLIGKKGTVAMVDTAFSPQPFYRQYTRALLLKATLVAQPGDYQFVFSADAISLAELQSRNTLIVLKDSAGNEETFTIVSYSIAELQAEAISFEVAARSTSR